VPRFLSFIVSWILLLLLARPEGGARRVEA